MNALLAAGSRVLTAVLVYGFLAILGVLASARAIGTKPPAAPPPVTTPALAADATARGPSCANVAPFYWEIGSSTDVLASGTTDGAPQSRATVFSVDSASKWVYAAYVAQIKAGLLSDDDRRFLMLESGFATFNPLLCRPQQTVAQCASAGKNDTYTAAYDGQFYYGGGHMQQHALAMGLGSLNGAALAVKINAALGTAFSYDAAQLAGGLSATPAQYATFLQRIMSGQLAAMSSLGGPSVCTMESPECPTAVNSPAREAWHYGLGHWIEDAPGDDGAFSSVGAQGFYPWISADGQRYGIVAPEQVGSWQAVQCGRLIRKAFATGVPQ